MPHHFFLIQHTIHMSNEMGNWDILKYFKSASWLGFSQPWDIYLDNKYINNM